MVARLLLFLALFLWIPSADASASCAGITCTQFGELMCFPGSFICDKFQDCDDGSDEDLCTTIRNETESVKIEFWVPGPEYHPSITRGYFRYDLGDKLNDDNGETGWTFVNQDSDDHSFTLIQVIPPARITTLNIHAETMFFFDRGHTKKVGAQWNCQQIGLELPRCSKDPEYDRRIMQNASQMANPKRFSYCRWSGSGGSRSYYGESMGTNIIDINADDVHECALFDRSNKLVTGYGCEGLSVTDTTINTPSIPIDVKNDISIVCTGISHLTPAYPQKTVGVLNTPRLGPFDWTEAANTECFQRSWKGMKLPACTPREILELKELSENGGPNEMWCEWKDEDADGTWSSGFATYYANPESYPTIPGR